MRSRRWTARNSSTSSGRDERDGGAAGAGPARSADAVDVVLGLERQLVVDDVREVLDVEAARSHVRGDEDLDEAAAEGLQGAGPLLLAAVAVDRGAADAAPVQVRGQPAGADLAAGEDQDLLHRVAQDQMDAAGPPCDPGRPGRGPGSGCRRCCSGRRPRRSPGRAGTPSPAGGSRPRRWPRTSGSGAGRAAGPRSCGRPG